MTSGIDASGRIASIVRAAVAAQLTEKNATRSGGALPDGSRKLPSDIGALIARRVGAVAMDDPHRERKVFRAFLEATLLAELGEHLINDPRFRDMVDAVQDQMESDPQISEAVDQAVRVLLTPPPSA